MSDQRITQLTSLPKAGVAATDVLPIADISASQTKKVTAKDLVDAGLDLIDVSSIDIDKLDQASVTKLGTTALADDAVTAAKLANDSSIAVQTTAPVSDNFEGRGYFNSTSKALQVFDGSTYQQVIAPTAGIGDLQVTTGKLADGAVTTAKVTALGTAAYADSSVTTAKIADGAVTGAKIATDTITATQVAPNAIGASELADNAVDTAAIVSLAVTEAKLAADSVTNAKLGDLAVTNAKIADTTIAYGKLNLADGSVPGAKITTDSITATQIAANAVNTSELVDTAVTTAKLADGAVTAAKIATDSITTAQIAPSAVGASELADNAVDTAAIVNLAVTEAKLGDDSVTVNKLGSLAVTDAKIAATTITYGKLNLADGSIPGAKIATDSITATQIAAGAVNTSELVDAAVTTAKIADGAITSAKIADGTITGSGISAGSLTGVGLASATVTYAKIQNVSATDRFLGRVSAGAGSIEEITCTSAGRALLDDADAATQRDTLGLGTISTGNGTWTDGASFSGTSSGTNTGDQTITLTGDVTGTGTGSFATAITASAVTEGAIAANAVTASKINADAVTAEKLADGSAAVVAASSPAGDGAFIGQQWFNTNNGQEFTWTGSAWLQQAGIGTINIVDSTPLAIAVTYPDAYSATLTTTLDTQTAASVFAGPTTGADAAPTFRAIVPGDLPDATVSTKGIIQPGTGLAVTTGVLNHTNTVTGATVSSITFDNQGHITAAAPLVAADIPVLDASKITTGTFPTALIADASVTAVKIADYANAQIGETLPVADHIGQFFFNPLEGSVFLWDGNVWQPVGVTTGAIIFAGTFNAASPSGVGQVATVTAAGSAIGLVAGNALPAASATNSEYYLVVSSGGTITSGNAPLATLAPPDLVLSNGTSWVEVDVSTGAGAIAASNVSFTAGGDIAATNVQTAIAEVSSECRNADNITSGTLAVARGGTGLASYAKGDLVAATAATTLAKRTVGTNGQVLTANSADATGLTWSTPTTGTVTTVSSSTAALTVATATTTPALTVRSATTSVDGIVQLSDSTSTTSSVLAATPTAVKSAYDLAALALPKAGGTVTGDITLGTNVGIQFEGTTDDANEIRLIGADATADRTITLPNVTGTVITTGDSGTVTSTMIADGAIVNADINASAAIVDTKLATIATAGKVSNAATTATSALGANTIVARDGSNNFSAGTITASLTGTASGNVRQGGGSSQLGNTVYIGWSAASLLRLQVDSTDFGATWPISTTGNAATVTNGVYTTGNQAIAGNKTFSGNIYTGTENSNPADNNIANSSRIGDGYLIASRTDAVVAWLNRSNTGGIIKFKRAGVDTGGIEVSDTGLSVLATGNLLLGGNNSTKLELLSTGVSRFTGRTEIATTGDIFSGAANNTLADTTERFFFSAAAGTGNTICGSGSQVLTVSRSTATDGNVLRFGRGGAAAVGTISVSAGATAYNTSSDYRLKENITPLDGAIARLNQLPVHRFNFIADPDTVVDGFIAHEAAAVVPECVTGEKDEEDEDGEPIYQGIDQSKLVPLLTAALQEAIAKINALEARIAALEA